jgi:transposase-like protein
MVKSPLHFLLTAQARTLSVLQVARISDDDAFALFKRLRWGDREEVACPRCGLVHKHYFIQTRHIWKCAGCRETFSVTSGTVFASHKLPLKTYLAAVALFTNAVKGISALQLARDLGVQHKTAFVLSHKIRESLMVHQDNSPLSGGVEIDGAYVNGHIRPKNKKEGRVDRRQAENQSPDKRCLLVIRENHHKESRSDGHLFISVLAYQGVQLIRRQLKAKGIDASWSSLRETLSVQRRVTASFTRKDGRTLHVRKAIQPEPRLKAIYSALGLDPLPGGTKRLAA